MPAWNQWSEDVAKERDTVRNYGGPGKAPRHENTYKAQALRLLAEKQLMEGQISDLQHRVNAAVDLLDGASVALLADALRMEDKEVSVLLGRLFNA